MGNEHTSAAHGCALTRYLVHDNIVDSVLIMVFVVAQPHGEALWVISLEVLHNHENKYQLHS